VDTSRFCLAQATTHIKYVTLSYVSGTANFLETTTSNIQKVQQEGALLRPKLSQHLLKAIKNAIQLAERLGEPYIWIGRLCVVQDDEAQLMEQIINTTSFFGNASFTIGAVQGEDADFRLPG
jgi:hypothetical protein